MDVFLGASVFLGLAVLGLGNADEIINHFGTLCRHPVGHQDT